MYSTAQRRRIEDSIGELAISTPRPDGTVDVLHADPIVSVRTRNLHLLGVGHLLQEDGTLRLTDEVRYRPLLDLRDGATAFERI